jgi:hypothetical protein
MRAVVEAIVVLLVLAAPARAEFGFQSFEAPLHDGAGMEVDQAGAHPDQTVRFELNRTLNAQGRVVPDESLKTVAVRMPPGFVGNPEATPKCAHRDFRVGDCSHLSMVGVSAIGYSAFPLVPPAEPNEEVSPVYNLVPPEGVAAQLGFQVVNVSIIVTVTVRPDGGYNLAADLTDLSQNLQLYSSELTLWGVPADLNGPGPFAYSGGTYGGPGGGPRIPFLTSPTRCDERLTTTIRAESWQSPGEFVAASYASAAPLTGCDRLAFNPALTVLPATTQADSPSGYTVELRVPQNQDPDGLATATLRNAVVTMPEGVTVSPSSANGLQGCTDEQFARLSTEAATCPAASKIGAVAIDTPVLAEVMTGNIHVGQPASDDPASGRMFRIFVEARGSGVTVKLEGQVRADPATGRLTAVFEENPQLPFDSFRLTFDGGPQAALANPPGCGAKTAAGRLSPWTGGAPAEVSSTYLIGCLGIGGFAPVFSAGTVNPVAGSFSPLALRFARSDREEYLSGLTVEMPPGLLARLGDVPLCADAHAAAGACPLESRIGHAVVGAGPGPAPFHTAPQHGSVYLTEGYKGAPYGLAVVVRAIAGPYDLGTVVVRQAIHVNPTDAHLTVVSDPLPQILRGVPLRLRSVAVHIDRAGFVLNPTSCAERQIRATLASAGGAQHQAATRFQVGDCRALPFKPKLRLRLLGRRQMRDRRHPGLRAVLTQREGGANLAGAAVTLPLSLALDPHNSQQLCEFADGQKTEPTCPRASIVGRAVAHTPILRRPLEGPVYFVKNIRIHPRTGRQIRTLPSLVIPLRGEVAINLRATTSTRRGKLVSTFAGVPDAPVSRFVLRLRGGRRGILVTTRDVCDRPRRHIADLELDGHNGKRADGATRFKTPCSRRGRR